MININLTEAEVSALLYFVEDATPENEQERALINDLFFKLWTPLQDCPCCQGMLERERAEELIEGGKINNEKI